MFSSVCLYASRYPVVLKRFHLNAGTGGSGAFCGGDGVVREFLFRKPLTLSVLTERRVFSPYGLKGVNSIILFQWFICKNVFYCLLYC